MQKLLDEFRNRRSFITNMNYRESRSRISGFLDWLDSNEITATIVSNIEDNDKADAILKKAHYNDPPEVSSPEDVLQIGINFMRRVKSGQELWAFSQAYGIRPSFTTNSIQLMQDEIVNRYLEPVLNYIEDKLIESLETTEHTYEHPSSVHVLSGDFRGAILNINSTLNRSSQSVRNAPNTDENIKEELISLLDELKKVLSETPPEKADSAEAIAWAAETLIEEKMSEKTNPIKIEITKDGLLKAASNIATIMPTVVVIAEKIIAIIDKIK